MVQGVAVVQGKGKVTEQTKGEAVAAQIVSSQRSLVSCSKSVCVTLSENAVITPGFSHTSV